MIIGNKDNGGPKVYDVTKYLDDHPGGAEVLLEVGGKYADDMFEDIGHSNEARKQLTQFLVGPLEATEEEMEALTASAVSTGGGGGFMVRSSQYLFFKNGRADRCRRWTCRCGRRVLLLHAAELNQEQREYENYCFPFVLLTIFTHTFPF